MKRYKSPAIFHQCDLQARKVLSLYETYRVIPRFPQGPELTQQQVGYIILAGVLTLALCFTIQAEIYVGQGVMTGILGADHWLVGVLAVLAGGLVSSVIISELLPGTRLLTATAGAGVSDSVDALMDKLKGVRGEGRSIRELLRASALGFVVVMFLFISCCSIYHAIRSGNRLQALFPPLLFLFDSFFGVGPVWLVTFGCNRLRILQQNRWAENCYLELEAAWNLVAELYNAGKNRYFEEHPNLTGELDKLPPVSPLTAFIITNPCFREVEIPVDLFRAAPAAPTPKPEEEETSEDPIKEAAPIFSAMDSDVEANNEKA